MKEIEKALEEEANVQLRKEVDELGKFLFNNPLARNILIEIGDKQLSLTDDIFKWIGQDTYETDNVSAISFSKRRKEIIKEILNNYKKTKVVEEKKSEKEDIIEVFLDSEINKATKSLTGTIQAINRGYIQSNGAEISLYQDIITSLNYVKENYLTNKN